MHLKNIGRDEVINLKNFEIINYLNNIDAFAESEKKANKALLSVKGQFAVKRNLNKLLEEYKVYDDVRKGIMADDISENERNEKIRELLNTDAGEIELRKITEDDFYDGCTLSDITLLDFMIKE